MSVKVDFYNQFHHKMLLSDFFNNGIITSNLSLQSVGSAEYILQGVFKPPTFEEYFFRPRLHY